MAQVAPNQGGSDVMDLGILSLSSLNPDLNNDGKLDPCMMAAGGGDV